MEDKFEYSTKCHLMFRELFEGREYLLHEYYERANSPKDNHILKDLDIYVYIGDRTPMTPHCHLKDNDGVEIEVSLIDWQIVNVKNPSGKKCEWGEFTSIRNRFFEWIDKQENAEKVFRIWNKCNVDNLLEEYQDKTNISDQLKIYFAKKNNPVILDDFRDEIYNVLGALFADKKEKRKLKDLDTLELLKRTGLYDKYHLEDAGKEVFKTAENAIKHVKIWFSYI